MLKTVEKEFRYHEFYTDSENFVKDIARLLALGVSTEAVTDVAGNIVKPSLPIVDDNWKIIYPAVDKLQFSDVEDWERLTPEEYDRITKWQISQITDTAIIKTKTLPKAFAKTANLSGFGFNDDLNQESCEMHLEIYMPPYLCDTEVDDPILQKTGHQPKVLDPRGYDPASPNTKVIRNYYHAFFRIFDIINSAGDGPKENEIDPVTNEVRRWNSRSSEWSKLAWYNDFEDKYISELIGKPERGMLDGSVRMPIEPGISTQTKIKLWANVNRDRLVLSCMGSPNIDFGDERYLISCAYVGAIDSFDFSINDTAGNFGIFTTSSSVPSIGETTLNTRQARQAGAVVMMENPAKPGEMIPDTYAHVDGPTSKFYLDGSIPGFSLQAFPKTIDLDTVKTFEMQLPVVQDNIKDTTRPGGGPHWGEVYIAENDMRVAVQIQCIQGRIVSDFSKTADYIVNYTDVNGVQGSKTMKAGVTEGEGFAPISMEIHSYKLVIDPDNKKICTIHIDVEGLMKEIKTALAIPAEIKSISVGNFFAVQSAFKIYTQYTTQTGGVTRDRFGNIVKIEYRTKYGKNSANGTTDFAMYHTFGKDYFQKHHFMFTSTEEFMQKELYGKSVYTGEYFADRIKIVHGSEGPRGILKAMITVDTSSLYAFDELIVNKDFKKYEDEPEELFVYLPVTAPYCPFSNSPNGRHGIGILKEIRYPVPETDEDFVAYAIRELERKYGDLHYVINNINLINTSEHGVDITWESSDIETISIVDESSASNKTKGVSK